MKMKSVTMKGRGEACGEKSQSWQMVKQKSSTWHLISLVRKAQTCDEMDVQRCMKGFILDNTAERH